MKLVLASASPRRAQLIRQITSDIVIIKSNYSEPIKAMPPHIYAMDCAKKKALDVHNRCGLCGDVILGADTVVVLEGKIMGKPSDEKTARAMLTSLWGKTHSVITGVCIITKHQTVCAYEESKVAFSQPNDETVEAYLKSGSPYDKAGAYGIQDTLIRPYASVCGNIDNVMGLPVGLVRKLLEQEKKE